MFGFKNFLKSRKDRGKGRKISRLALLKIRRKLKYEKVILLCRLKKVIRELNEVESILQKGVGHQDNPDEIHLCFLT